MRRHFFYSFIALFLLVLTSCQSQTKVVNSVPAREANEIVVLLNSKGIPAQKTPAAATGVGGTGTSEQYWDITVPSNQITEALSILNQLGLPREKGTTLLDLFGSQGLVPSDMQDRIRYQEGLSEQLASTIRKMDGVIDANVQISFPQGEETTRPLTASVYIKHQGVLDNPNSLLVTKIKRLVASAVPGLTVDNVSVVTDRASFSDITIPSKEGFFEDHKEYVSIWSVIVAKESATRFRVIFYIFIFLLFLVSSALLWVLWKFYLILMDRGGLAILLKPEQLPIEQPEKSVEDEQT